MSNIDHLMHLIGALEASAVAVGRAPTSVAREALFDARAALVTAVREALRNVTATAADPSVSPAMSGKLDTKQAAKRYGCTVGHLARLRVQGRGPEFELIKGRVYYTPESIDAALAANTSPRHKSTAEYETSRARRRKGDA